MTATTTSSLMSCVSTLLPSCDKLPGDGGGVNCAEAVGFSDAVEMDFRALGRVVSVVEGRAEVSRVCDRLTRLAGGFPDVPAVVGDGLGGDTLEPRDCGSWTPRLCRFSETRRVE